MEMCQAISTIDNPFILCYSPDRVGLNKALCPAMMQSKVTEGTEGTPFPSASNVRYNFLLSNQEIDLCQTSL
jgi:hypothetical protein